jgi:Flp pilus assembly protein TadG
VSRSVGDQRGAAAAEFAIVAPVFLMFLFALLDGGRLLFAKQAVNELATAAARCAAIKPSGCTSAAEVKSWTVARGLKRSRMKLTAANVVVNMAGTCNTVSAAVVTVNAPVKRGRMTLLPQSALPANLSATACFPRA